MAPGHPTSTLAVGQSSSCPISFFHNSCAEFKTKNNFVNGDRYTLAFRKNSVLPSSLNWGKFSTTPMALKTWKLNTSSPRLLSLVTEISLIDGGERLLRRVETLRDESRAWKGGRYIYIYSKRSPSKVVFPLRQSRVTWKEATSFDHFLT